MNGRPLHFEGTAAVRPSEKAITGGSLATPTTFALVGILSLTTLLDYYILSWGVRPFDLAAFFGLSVLMVVVVGRSQAKALGSRRDGLLIAAIAALGFLYFFVGVFVDTGNENAKTGIGFVMGLPFLFAFRQLPLDKQLAARLTSILLLAHVAFLLIQDVYFYETSTVLNPMSVIGIDVRAMSDTFRPTGLYQEPCTFAVSMAMLLAIRLSLNPRFDIPVVAGFVAILASFSLWGLWSMPALLLAYAPRSKQSLLAVAVATALVVGVVVYREDTDEIIGRNVDAISARFDKVGSSSDSSAEVRYGPLLQLIGAPDKWEIADLVGSGLSSEYHRYGANGYAPLLRAGGVCGLAAIWGLLVALARKHPWRMLLLLGLFGSAPPLWTYFFWWSWLGITSRADLDDGRAAVGLFDGLVSSWKARRPLGPESSRRVAQPMTSSGSP
jgi:hypothetical protein